LQIEGNGVAALHYLDFSIGKRVSNLGAPGLFFGFGARFRLFGAVYGAASGLCYRVWYCGAACWHLDPGCLTPGCGLAVGSGPRSWS